MEDHPRLRGEHAKASICLKIDVGLPPPTGGTLSSISRNVNCIRITPAYAGNTQHHLHLPLHEWDHPRLRGEHGREDWANRIWVGSPPPTRGTHSY